MFGILVAAVLAKPLAKQKLVSMPFALILVGFISSEIWVALGQDTGLRWEILRDLVFYLLLPVLIFEASLNINVSQLRREGVLVFSLAVPLLLIATLISALVIQTLMGGMLGNIWALTFLCGAMISATDPTTLGSILGNSQSPGRVIGILEGEGLINDAASITLFVMISSMLTMQGYDLNLPGFAGRFVLVLAGSVLLGVFLGWLFDQIISPLNDVVLTTSVSLVLAFFSFWAGEHIPGWSGVVSTLSSGLTIAYLQRKHRNEKDVAFAFGSWRILGFLADAMLFFPRRHEHYHGYVPDSLVGNADRNSRGTDITRSNSLFGCRLDFPPAPSTTAAVGRAEPHVVGRDSWCGCHCSGLSNECRDSLLVHDPEYGLRRSLIQPDYTGAGVFTFIPIKGAFQTGGPRPLIIFKPTNKIRATLSGPFPDPIPAIRYQAIPVDLFHSDESRQLVTVQAEKPPHP